MNANQFPDADPKLVRSFQEFGTELVLGFKEGRPQGNNLSRSRTSYFGKGRPFQGGPPYHLERLAEASSDVTETNNSSNVGGDPKIMATVLL